MQLSQRAVDQLPQPVIPITSQIESSFNSTPLIDHQSEKPKSDPLDNPADLSVCPLPSASSAVSSKSTITMRIDYHRNGESVIEKVNIPADHELTMCIDKKCPDGCKFAYRGHPLDENGHKYCTIEFIGKYGYLKLSDDEVSLERTVPKKGTVPDSVSRLTAHVSPNHESRENDKLSQIRSQLRDMGLNKA
jgi:hypothetical protein